MNTDAPYRHDPTQKKATPPQSIELIWGNGEHKIDAVLLFRGLGFGVAVVGLCSVANSTLAIVVGFVVCFVAIRYINKRARSAKIVLSVESGILNVHVDGKPRHTFVIEKIVSVEQETRTHSRVTIQQQVKSPIPTSEVGLAVDIARVVIVHGDERVPLTESFSMSYECTEVFAKVRVFLRKHGWIPLDEQTSKT
jgi:hypothetical protein